MPKNTSAGFIIGVLAFFTGFGLVWHIGWLAAGAALGILATLVFRMMQDEVEYSIPAEEVARIEGSRLNARGAA
jgi:cytochrome o ubiquinol oxidase subunit 1